MPSCATRDNQTGPAASLGCTRRQLLLGNAHARDAVLRLYGGQDTLAQAFRAGADSRMQTSQTLTGAQMQSVQVMQPNDMVLVVSEFGRTCAENGSRGTDHGHGNAFWLMGSQVNGGRWHGRWDGLAQAQLHEGRDLPVHHDFRAVLAHVLQRTQGLDATQLSRLFPGYAWDKSLDGLMRA